MEIFYKDVCRNFITIHKGNYFESILLVMVSFWRISLMENGHVDGGEWLYGNVGFTTNDS